MGVIDLDARVKKLEQDAGSGAVIDQLEAAVTALEEQINGDGETDLGLAGDVTALETAVNNLAFTHVPVTPTGGVADAGAGGVYYDYNSNMVHVHIAVTDLTVHTATVIFSIPAAFRPVTRIYADGIGSNLETTSHLYVSETDGSVSINSDGTSAYADFCYPLISTT